MTDYRQWELLNLNAKQAYAPTSDVDVLLVNNFVYENNKILDNMAVYTETLISSGR